MRCEGARGSAQRRTRTEQWSCALVYVHCPYVPSCSHAPPPCTRPHGRRSSRCLERADSISKNWFMKLIKIRVLRQVHRTLAKAGTPVAGGTPQDGQEGQEEQERWQEKSGRYVYPGVERSCRGGARSMSSCFHAARQSPRRSPPASGNRASRCVLPHAFGACVTV